MKTLIICLLLAPVISYSQSIDESTKNRIVENFRNSYVEENFKDPYSFELLKFEATPLTASKGIDEDLAKVIVEMVQFDTMDANKKIEKLVKESNSLSRKIDKAKNPTKRIEYEIEQDAVASRIADLEVKKNYLTNLQKRYTKERAELSESDAGKIRDYMVLLDCYGTNDYGAKILGRYKFRTDLDGNIKWDVQKLN